MSAEPDVRAASSRVQPNVDHRHLLRGKSSRNGAGLRLIVIHDTEGANIKGIRDLIGLGNYFESVYGSARSSSCHVATDADGNSARFVRDEDKAWHCAYFNPWSLGIEQIGFASQRVWPEAQLRETARWIAYWSYHHNVPIQKGRVKSTGVIVRNGVIRHSELGALGGGHADPGKPYPLARVLSYARGYREEY